MKVSIFSKLYKILFFTSAILLTFLVRDHAFFWDTPQFGSIHAQFYFENNFGEFWLTQNMDSGHPPTFGMYIAMVWNFFGKNLPVSHFAMLPFLFGIIYYLDKIGKYYFKSSLFVFAFILLNVLDPCVAGQAILVSPDMVLLFFFLMTLYGILENKKTHIIIGSLGLCLISTRGMMTAATLFVFELLHSVFLTKEKISFSFFWKKLSPYVLGASVGFLFLITHYFHTGWIGYHPESPWAASFEKVGFQGFIKNLAVLGWRMVDFGRIFLWIIIFIFGINILRKGKQMDKKLSQLILLFSCLFIFLTPPLLTHKMLLGHRYMLPIFILTNFIFLYLVVQYVSSIRLKNLLVTIGIIGLATGNLWVYPKHIAQGWDSTLATMPYFQLRKNMLKFINEKNIPLGKIGSTFPNNHSFKILDLTEDERKFERKDLENNQYIFYSNVFNDFTDEELVELETEWEVIKKYERMNIEVILYKKNR